MRAQSLPWKISAFKGQIAEALNPLIIFAGFNSNNFLWFLNGSDFGFIYVPYWWSTKFIFLEKALICFKESCNISPIKWCCSAHRCRFWFLNVRWGFLCMKFWNQSGPALIIWCQEGWIFLKLSCTAHWSGSFLISIKSNLKYISAYLRTFYGILL